jgi:hypothetical protein
MLNRENLTWIRLSFDDLSGFLVKKVKEVLKLRGKGYRVEKDENGAYIMEFRNPVSRPREDYDKLADLLTRLGFVPARIEDGDPKIYEYINDDNVTVTLIYSEDENNVYIRRITIGNTVPGHIAELIRTLRSFEVGFKHVVAPMTHIVKVSGVLKGVNDDNSLEFYHNSCVKIGIRNRKEDGNKELEISDICDSVSQKVELPKRSGVGYSEGTLHISLPHT